MENSTTTCIFSDPRWILKSGEIRTLEPLETAGTNVNFQFQKMECVGGNSTTNSTTIGTGIIIFIVAFIALIIAYKRN